MAGVRAASNEIEAWVLLQRWEVLDGPRSRDPCYDGERHLLVYQVCTVKKKQLEQFRKLACVAMSFLFLSESSELKRRQG